MGRMSKNSIQLLAEYNHCRWGLIALQSKTPAPEFLQGWSSSSADGTQTISCETTKGHTIPYGKDNDFFAGLYTAASLYQSDTGQNPTMELKVSELLRLSGLSLENRHYRDLKSSLLSLRYTNYQANDMIQLPVLGKTYEKESHFSIISDLEFHTLDDHFDPRKKIQMVTVQLSNTVFRSLAGPHNLSLNTQTIKQLGNPTVKGLYRLLEALRRDLRDPRRRETEVSILLLDFANAARILNNEPYLSKRVSTLFRTGGPMEALSDKKLKFLKSYSIKGRGDAAVLTLEFYDDDAVDTRGRDLLIAEGVTKNAAEEAIKAHSLEEIECAIWITDTAKSVKSRPSYILTVLTTGSARERLEEYRRRDKKHSVRNIKTVNQREANPATPTAPAKAEQAKLENQETERELPAGFTLSARTVEQAYTILDRLRPVKRLSDKTVQLCRTLLDEGRVKPEEIGSLIMLPEQMLTTVVEEWSRR